MCNRNALLRSQRLRANANHVPFHAFQSRKQYFQQAFASGSYLKNPEEAKEGSAQKNPLEAMADSSMTDNMVESVKKNMAMLVPQTIIMSWINSFFSGFVLSMCQVPFLF